MLLGSVSRKLAVHAHCPLVVVRGEPGETVLDEVVLGITPDQSTKVLRFAFAAASTYGATLHAVRAWAPVTIYTGPTGGYAEDLTARKAEESKDVEQLLAPLRTAFPEVKVEVSIERGNPVPLLIEAGRAARLVVVGAHRHRGPLAVGAGYVVDGLLAHSPTPVAVVPVHS
jgi:nucleotide-binding universal stress UspA family protein